MKLTRRQTWLLREAARRFLRFGIREGRSLTAAWTGLGAPSTYAPVTRCEPPLMQPVHSPERTRVNNWYCLTAKGAEVVAGWISEGLTVEEIEKS